jgi:hypothetical protein
MSYKKSLNSLTFECDKCDYITNKKTDFSKHLDTIKHKKRANTYEMVTNGYEKVTDGYVKCDKLAKQYKCECGKSYNHRQNLYVHRKKCDFKNEEKIEKKDEIIKKTENNEELFEKFAEMIQKNNEKTSEYYKELFLKFAENQTKLITDLIPKIGNNNNTNTNSNNTVKQKFNVNVFLNEQCKDAISLNDFVKNIEVSISDLFVSKDKGLVKGISNLFIKHLNELPIVQRPLWCSDKKRKKIYVKEETWTEDVDNNKTKEAIYNISKVQTGNINKYIENKPDWKSSDNDKTTYIDIVKSVTDAVDDSKKEKIIDSIIDVIHLTEDKVV